MPLERFGVIPGGYSLAGMIAGTLSITALTNFDATQVVTFNNGPGLITAVGIAVVASAGLTKDLTFTARADLYKIFTTSIVPNAAVPQMWFPDAGGTQWADVVAAADPIRLIPLMIHIDGQFTIYADVQNNTDAATKDVYGYIIVSPDESPS